MNLCVLGSGICVRAFFYAHGRDFYAFFNRNSLSLFSSNSLILSKSGFQSAPISRKRPCATLYVLSVPRHPFRAWNMPRPGRIVGRPDALGLVPVRLKVSMDRAFFDVLRHWCTLHAITERKHKERGSGA